MKRACLDNVAATPVLPEVVDAMFPYLKEAYGAIHSPCMTGGNEAREATEDARGHRWRPSSGPSPRGLSSPAPAPIKLYVRKSH